MLHRKGSVLFCRRRRHAHAGASGALAGIALGARGRRVFPALTVSENLEMGGFKYRKDRAKVRALIGRAMEMFPILRERATQARDSSGGESADAGSVRALMSEAAATVHG